MPYYPNLPERPSIIDSGAGPIHRTLPLEVFPTRVSIILLTCDPAVERLMHQYGRFVVCRAVPLQPPVSPHQRWILAISSRASARNREGCFFCPRLARAVNFRCPRTIRVARVLFRWLFLFFPLPPFPRYPPNSSRAPAGNHGFSVRPANQCFGRVKAVGRLKLDFREAMDGEITAYWRASN